MMIRDFLNTEDDPMDSVSEAAVCVRKGNDCACCDLSVTDVLPGGMTFAPMLVFRKLYTPEEALCRGTLFCELDLPFRGGKQR